jgi:membrane associated rhomboid family serine protease
MAMLIPIRDVNPTKRFGAVTFGLIAANVVAYLATSESLLGISRSAAFRYGAVPCDVIHRCARVSQELEQAFPGRSPWLTLVTSMFMHGDILHIAFNMLFLWVFGNNVEDQLGRFRFAAFYLITGLAAAFAHIYSAADSVTPIVGASGAISGVLGAYFVLWPRATVVNLVPLGFFFFTVRLPAFVSLGLWFVLQLFSGLAGSGIEQGDGGVAFWAHVGGFVAGMAFIIPFGGRRQPRGVVGGDRFDRPDFDDRFD